mmetsp:Transcript_10502/g.14723  ORF Transcript_10502/g.14723 Transcript_10502/m.14723 type:complete len:158 (-) Transcript_10502:51-524(-)
MLHWMFVRIWAAVVFVQDGFVDVAIIGSAARDAETCTVNMRLQLILWIQRKRGAVAAVVFKCQHLFYVRIFFVCLGVPSDVSKVYRCTHIFGGLILFSMLFRWVRRVGRLCVVVMCKGGIFCMYPRARSFLGMRATNNFVEETFLGKNKSRVGGTLQ